MRGARRSAPDKEREKDRCCLLSRRFPVDAKEEEESRAAFSAAAEAATALDRGGLRLVFLPLTLLLLLPGGGFFPMWWG